MLKGDVMHQTRNHPIGYWKDWDHVHDAVERMKKRLGRFPSSTDMQHLGETNLLYMIAKYHGGYRKLRERFGIEQYSVGRDFWKDWGNVEKEFRSIIKKIGHFPNQKELAQNGRSSLIYAAKSYFGGMSSVRQRLGFDIAQREPNYWKDLANVDKEMRLLIKKVGHFPNRREVAKHRMLSLWTAIHAYHGGMRKLRSRLGLGQASLPANHWRSWENVKTALLGLIKRFGYFPGGEEISCIPGFGAVPTAVRRYHGGMVEVRKRMGYPISEKPAGYWQDWENFQRELAAIIKKEGTFPSGKRLNALGFSVINSVMVKYHGGAPAVRQRLGFPIIKREMGYWRKWENVESEIRTLIEKLGHFPSQREMADSGTKTLMQGILYFGGMAKVRAKFGYSSSRQPNGFYKDFENLRAKLEEMIRELGHFPTTTELWKNKMSGLVNAVTAHHGGFNAVRARMGYQALHKPKGFWREWLNVEKSLIGIIDRLGRFPSAEDIRAENCSSLRAAIDTYHGGLTVVRERMGYLHISAELLKLNADELVRVLFALRKKLFGLKSDMLWSAIKKKWYAPDLEQALKKAKRGDLKAFEQLLAS
jgi:hypothetical protein